MKRLDALEARRRALLARCDQQRVEIAYEIARIESGRQIMKWTSRAPTAGGGRTLAVIAVIAAVILLIKPRRMLSSLAWITGAISLAARAARLVRLVGHLRALRAAAQ